MESINADIITKFGYCFNNFNLIKEKALFFNNYYSTATSTLMVISDLLFGDIKVFEESNYLEDLFSINVDYNSILDDLFFDGYKTKTFFISHPYNEYESMKKLNKIVNKNGDFFYTDSLKEFKIEFNLSIDCRNPFAFFIADYSSHIAYNGERNNCKFNSIISSFENRFKRIDDTIGIIMDTLITRNLLDNTIIIFYGDHGEEYYSHGFHQGFTHAIEPFNSISHCPLYLYDGNHCGIDSRLVSTIDIKKILKQLYTSNNIFLNNKFIFSRNLFK